MNGPLPWVHFALMGIVWLAIVGLVIAAIIALLRRPQYPAVVPSQAQMGPLDILSARYARGEIDATTYQAMRAHILTGDPPPTTI
ncbi:MAG: SHOCT domain-containing protein [Ktedonobacterales bacterium]|nr:SHOCT domain-containing protein [Ktedonobacterales bacterium]